MRTRYRILIAAIFLIKYSALAFGLIGTVAWFVGGGAIMAVTSRIPSGPAQEAITFTAVVAGLLQLAAVWIAVLLQWALGEFLEAIIDIAETNRMSTMLLVRQFRREFPDEKPEYMKSIHGVWDDAPAARVPDERWKKNMVTESRTTMDLGEKERVYRRVSGEPPRAEAPRYRRVRGPGDPR